MSLSPIITKINLVAITKLTPKQEFYKGIPHYLKKK